jgi:hypothetical protein
MNQLEERYHSTMSPANLANTLSELWAEVLAGNSPISAEAMEVASLDELRQQGELGINAYRDSSGLSPADTTIIITFAAKVSYHLWQYVLLPRVRQRWGDESLKRAKDDEGEVNRLAE